MRVLYNILFFVFFWLSAPFYFWKLWRRGNWQRGFGQRFGRHTGSLKYTLTNRHVIWVHAVSVGEANVCAQLIQALEPRLPLAKFVVSTTTTTGMGELQKKLPAHIEKIYYPVDFPKSVRRAIAAVHPEAVILVEAEIWPNFLWQLEEWKIPVFLVNARLSERSYPRYCKLDFLFKSLFRSFEAVGAQNESDVTRLKNVGCRPDAIQLTGNLKFDATHWKSSQALDVPGLLRRLGVRENARIIVAGSTHDGEEVMLAKQFQRLRKQFPDLFLIIVPRHMERAKRVADELRGCQLKFVLRKDVDTAKYKPGELECLVVNTTGELMYFYECATVAFVGKSITAKGGQNPIEPALLGKAMVFGPNMQNFRAIVAAFLEGKGAIQVRNATELQHAFADLLANDTKRNELGRNARMVVTKNQGAVERTVEMLAERLRKTCA